MPSYSDGWTPTDQAASTAFAHAMQASKAQQTQAERLRALEERVAALEARLNAESPPPARSG